MVVPSHYKYIYIYTASPKTKLCPLVVGIHAVLPLMIQIFGLDLLKVPVLSFTFYLAIKSPLAQSLFFFVKINSGKCRSMMVPKHDFLSLSWSLFGRGAPDHI